MIRVALLATDNREHLKQYALPAPIFGVAPEALLEGLSRAPGVEVHVVSCLQKPVSSPEKLAENIYYHGHHVPKLGWMRTGFQGCIRAVRRQLREIRPDIVHGQGTERDCGISAILSGYPNVITIHGNMAEIARRFQARPFSYGWLAARLEEFTLARTAGVFCNSLYTRSVVSPPARKTWLVPNALRRDFFEMPPSVASPAIPILLNIGVVSPRKRQVELLRWARNLHERGIRFELRFIGDISLADSYGTEFAAEVRIAEKEGFARFIGSLETEALIQEFDSASALIHYPSEEAFGLVVAEALARNLKFFGAREGGIQDIANGVDGAELVDVNDWKSLGDAVARWIDAGCPKPSIAAEEMARRYHPDKIARRHLEIYAEVLKSSV